MPRGRPKGSKNKSTVEKPKKKIIPKIVCPKCGKEYPETDFYTSQSIFFNGRLPYCKNCIDDVYRKFVKKFNDEGHNYPEKDAMRRLCMAYDIYFNDTVFNTAVKNLESQPYMSLLFAYFKIVKLVQYNSKTYDSTIDEEGFHIERAEPVNPIIISNETRIFFGEGFPDSDYEFLKTQYDDWTARHECNTKAQEEIFKQLCFTQLELLKATRAKQDTKDLTSTFQKLLETAKLQPKQNNSGTVSDSQTFGTLLDKWENTRPLPEIDEDLKDVDNIGRYIEVFFKGHLAKMMGIKNAFSNAYSKFMRKYTVEKPKYDNDEDKNSEIIFDAVFGDQSTEEDGE